MPPRRASRRVWAARFDVTLTTGGVGAATNNKAMRGAAPLRLRLPSLAPSRSRARAPPQCAQACWRARSPTDCDAPGVWRPGRSRATRRAPPRRGAARGRRGRPCTKSARRYFVATLGDPAELAAIPGRLLLREKAEPGGEVPSLLEARAAADRPLSNRLSHILSRRLGTAHRSPHWRWSVRDTVMRRWQAGSFSHAGPRAHELPSTCRDGWASR